MDGATCPFVCDMAAMACVCVFFVCALFVCLSVCLFVCVEIHFSSTFSMDDDCHFGGSRLKAQGSRLKPTLSACWKQDFGERVWFGLIALSGGPLCTSTLG